VPRREREATKSLLDVGVERLGDLLGALLLGVISWTVSSESTAIVLGVAAFLAFSGLAASRRLRDGYVQALENNLLNRVGAQPFVGSVGETIGNVTIGRQADSMIWKVRSYGDPMAQQIQSLRSGDPDIVRQNLDENLSPAFAASVIPLLGWDEVAAEAVRALRKMGPRITGQLIDVLLDANEDFAVRRRVPRVLSDFNSQRAVDGLIEGLSANRFEIRFRSAQALAKIKMRNPNVVMDAENITKAVQRELEAGTRQESKGIVTMNHVFRLLALIYPCEPLWAAHRGLESQDDHLRRTSLEYLENVLPARVWQRIVPAIEEGVPLAVAG
jgi:hypothetical protein